MQTNIVTHTQPNGATVEVATITHEGKEYTAFGAFFDEEHGIIHAYTGGIPGAYKLTSFDGRDIANLTLVSTYMNRNVWGGFPVKMYAWRCTYNGKTYSGRNSGPQMIVRMRTHM